MTFADVLTKKETKKGFGAVLDLEKQQGLSTGLGLKKPDLKTPAGLEAVAAKTGLGEEAKDILAAKGEKPKEIFSGGIISDVFDTLNALQYGVVGLIKGKGFIEGMKTRQSFSDKDALGEAGIPGVIGGILLDIAVDPLTYIPPIAILKGLGVVKAAKAIKVAAKSTKVGEFVANDLGRKFIYRFGQDPVYAEIAERSLRNVSVGTQNMLDIVKPLTKLDNESQRLISAARKAGKLESLPAELLEKARPAFNELDRLGKEAVDAGLLKKEIYDQNVGRYISRLYRKHEIPKGIVEKAKVVFDRKPLRIDIQRFMKRSDIPEDVREAMGEILEAGYPTAKGLIQLTQATERAKLFKNVAGKFAKEIGDDGFKLLPATKKLGDLANKWVPAPIFDDIQELIRVKTPFEKVTGKIVAGFKFGKVVLNPATHARNVMSNFILNDFEGLSPARLDIYGEAAKEIATKGKWFQEAKKVGLGLDTFASREIKDLLLDPANLSMGKKFRTVIDKVSDIYQKEEQWAKMAQYIFQRGKGLTPEDAWKVAERATFNYAQVTPFIRRLRENIFGIPFVTFTYKVTPQVVKTALTKPTKISNIGKIKNAIENLSDLKELEKERASEPDWIRDGFYVKLPIKDKFGRSAYLDLTYILPFGDLMSGQYLERGIKRETGLPESAPEAFLKKFPFLNLIKELARNQDFFGNKILKESDSLTEQIGDVVRHITKTYLPPLLADQIPGGYRKDGTRRPAAIQRVTELEKGGIEAGGSQTRTLMQELLRHVGLKVSPVDLETQERFSEQEKKRALETLLKEEGVISDFAIPFIPKR